MAAIPGVSTRADDFWQDQAEATAQHARVQQLLEAIPACRIPNALNLRETLDVAVDAATAVIAAERASRSVHALLLGDPNSALKQKLRWRDMLRRVHATGAKRMHLLDAAAIESGPAVDVEFALYTAELDVLEALAPSLRSPKLANQVKDHLQDRALQAMADRDTHQ